MAVAAVMLGAAACGSDGAATDDPPGDGPAAATPADAYRIAGCSSCHGTSAEGGVGPALAGHTPEQVRSQVRDPVGDMPSYSTAEVSDEQLDLIVEFIESLDAPAGGHDHGSHDHGHEG